MTIDKDDLLKSIMESLDRIDYIKTEDIPNIDLYMDQVTTFMDHRLKASTRNPGEDKILTKTMINNYAKNNLLPSPEKKKYSKEHVLLLIFIYYLKGILSINDIQMLLTPMTEKYFQSGKGYSVKDIYEEIFGIEKTRQDDLKKDIEDLYEKSQKTFQDAPKEDEDFFKLFSFICMLGYDVYVKKLLIEKLIDSMAKPKSPTTSTQTEKKKEDPKEKEKKK